ncbi:endonuclease/exonuclease/phosphatase family protein [Thalassiella azotivora]
MNHPTVDRPRRTVRARRLGAVATVAGLALAALASAPAAQAGTGDDKLRVVQHNTDMGGHQAALNAAQAWGDVDAITFQELCESQKNELVAAGWAVHWRAQKDGNARCPVTNGRTAKGNAIATKRGMGATSTHSLGSYGGRDFKLLCAEITGSGIAKSWVCTTHLALGYDDAPDGKANRTAQVNTITDVVNTWVGWDRRVVLTGDLNATPSSSELEPLYRVQGGGTDTDKFWEGDQSDNDYCGTGLCRDMQPTTDSKPPSPEHPEGRAARKLDYVFASFRGVDAHTGMSKGVVPVDSSGHHVIRGQVTFKPLG